MESCHILELMAYSMRRICASKSCESSTSPKGGKICDNGVSICSSYTVHRRQLERSRAERVDTNALASRV